MVDHLSPQRRFGVKVGLIGIAIVGALLAIPIGYMVCRVSVPKAHIAVLIKKTGHSLSNDQEIVSKEDFGKYKGLQEKVLAEGRHFYNPWSWSWQVVPQVEIPEGKLGVRIRLYGKDPPYGNVIAWNESEKGVVPEVLRAARYPINAWIVGQPKRAKDNYAEYIELHDPVTIPAGFKGVVTNLSSPMPDDPNVLLVDDDRRGVQQETLEPGTYYINPYVHQINLVDCRSQRFNLATGGEMGFPSKDGFWVTLDGRIEFRIDPAQAARVFVTYNDISNDKGRDARVEEEIINKIILPNARSFCRLRGSDHSGKDFISGDTRTKFQEDFQAELEKTCESQGIQIIQALITRINPPQKIAQPVRQRQIALQQKNQFNKQMLQQESEKKLKIEQELVKRKQALVAAEQEVVKLTTEAKRKQDVAVIEANQRLKVAEVELEAARDMALAIQARGKAAADVIQFQNEAEAAGWKKAVTAFQGDGHEYARWVLLKKLAPAFRQMMVNTADSPLMDIFQDYSTSKPVTSSAADRPSESRPGDVSAVPSTPPQQP